MKTMSKELAEAKLEVGRAKKVLWQWRDKDIEEFEYIEAITYLEKCVENLIKEEVRACSVEVEDAIESQKEEGREVPDWLKGQLHAFNKCLRILSETESVTDNLTFNEGNKKEPNIIKWVRVSDRLPKKNEWIITVDFSEDDGMYNVFNYNNDEQHLYTHWMSLPNPPTNLTFNED